jgi:DNA-directed RNA polymerase subunit omega
MPAQPRNTLMNPPIEDLLDKVDSKFTLVALSSKRARQINSYYNQLGEGMGVVVPPQVTSVSGKPLTIAFEEVAAGKATYHRPEPGEEIEGIEGLAEVPALDSDLAALDVPGIDILAVTEPAPVEAALADLGPADLESIEIEPVDIETLEAEPVALAAAEADLDDSAAGETGTGDGSQTSAD